MGFEGKNSEFLRLVQYLAKGPCGLQVVNKTNKQKKANIILSSPNLIIDTVRNRVSRIFRGGEKNLCKVKIKLVSFKTRILIFFIQNFSREL